VKASATSERGMSMKQNAFGTSSVAEEEQRIALQDTPAEQSTPAALRRETACDALSVPQLAAQCLKEIDNYRRGEPYSDVYALELLHRATVQGDQEAWTWMQHCFSGLVLGWLYRHPSRETACRLESEENYVAQAFERFWQATTLTQRVEFSTLAAALHYLHMSLNAAIIDSLRTYARSREVSLPEPGEAGEPYAEDTSDSSEVWEVVKTMLPNEREQRLAYLLYYCGLKPREIVRFCSLEWSDVHEIYRLRRIIMERLLRNVDQLRWRLS
jgi:DNA-directed RNA polymerase specialized sigma24 family protein